MKNELRPLSAAPVEPLVSAIFDLYQMKYGSEIQGCCLLIADEIQRTVGGDVVAGELTWYGGSCRRTHWWVEKDGQTLDPMGDWLLSFEDQTGRCEHHRDRAVFDSILPNYERWRISR
jgi:hypothetical protein